MLKKLIFLVGLLLASPAFAQVGYFQRTDCGTLKPVESQTLCLQATTVSGRTAGHLYVYRGAAWVDVDSAGGGGSGDIEGVTAGTNLTGGGTTGTVTLNVANPVVANLTGNVTGNVTGNAGTATALAANGANCTAGNAPLGVDASGAVESCFDVATQTELNTHGALTGTSAHGAVATNTASQIVTRDASGNFAAGTITATLSGNATTATTAASVAANSVALGTDTTGDYVSSATANQGLLVTGTEGASVGLIDCAANEILKRNAGDTAWACATDSTGGTPSFDTIAAGTNTTAAMVVGTGGSLAVSGSGTIAATTAAALAANGANCSAGSAPLGVDAAGAVESCFDVATQTELDAHINDTSAAHAGSAIANTPAGNIAATDVQAAINELDGEKQGVLTNSAGLAGALNDETGTGAAVFANTPTLVTPVLGAATGTSLNLSGLTASRCVETDASKNLVSAAAACGTGGGTVQFIEPGLRLTLTTAVPVTTSDVTAAGTLYYTPYKSCRIVSVVSSVLADACITEISLALTLTSGKNYDVFVSCTNATTCALALSAAWTNDTTRADALARETLCGCQVLSSDHTKLWIGTLRASGANTTEDSAGGTTTQVGGKRFLWNVYNRVRRNILVIDTTDNWSYTTNTWRQSNGAAGNKVEWVTGDAGNLINATSRASVFASNTTGGIAQTGVGIDSTTAPSGFAQAVYAVTATQTASIYGPINAAYSGHPGLGYHYAAWLEKGNTATSMLFIGDNAGDGQKTGLDAFGDF